MRDCKLAELTIDELRKVTWDYSLEGAIGCYQSKIIRAYLFEPKEHGEVNLLTIQRCNVAEGWVEHYEFVEPPYVDESGKPQYSMPKFTPDFEPVRTKVNCKVVVDLLDSSGRVILTLRSE